MPAAARSLRDEPQVVKNLGMRFVSGLARQRVRRLEIYSGEVTAWKSCSTSSAVFTLLFRTIHQGSGPTRKSSSRLRLARSAGRTSFASPSGNVASEGRR